MDMKPVNLNDSLVFSGLLDRSSQERLLDELRVVAKDAHFRQYETRGGRKIGVRMTSAGKYGWVSDQNGYRYEKLQPDGRPWPEIPQRLIDLWRSIVGQDERLPQCCLVNFYGEMVRMGLHQDNDEADLTRPVLSISLGDDALFRVGGASKSDPTRSIWLRSGDVVLLQGQSRLAFHGIDKIRFGSSTLLPNGGRINVTLRVVD